MDFILGQKKEMSQVFSEDGRVRPATAIEAGPMVVTQVKTGEKDGYNAVQFGFGKKSPKRIKKPQRAKNVRWMREFKVEDTSEFEVGAVIDAGIFKEGDEIKVSAISKGKGFQGVVKRHGFHGGPRTHGQKHSEREPGSIGATWPQRVLKGKRMAGRMGGERVTWRGIKIMKVDAENNIIALKGAVPGRKGTLLEIRASI